MTETLIDVGGHRLALRTTGTGAPPVVCLASLGGGHDEWAQVVPLLSGVTTCVTYGRPGIEGSDPLPIGEVEQNRSVRGAADQLRTLLRRAEITPPYVLATGSIGAFIADRYAAAFPADVAGMVLVDPTMPSTWPGAERESDTLEDGDDGFRWSWKACFADLAEPLPVVPPRAVVLSSSVGRWVRDPPSRPWWGSLTLPEVDEQWQAFQRDWVQRLGATQVVADTAGHHVYREEPRLVAAVVEAVVAAVRDDEDVALDGSVLGPVAGYLASG